MTLQSLLHFEIIFLLLISMTKRIWLRNTDNFVSKGGFPLSRNFYVRFPCVITCIRYLEALYEMSQVYVKIETRSTFPFSRDASYVASILFTRVLTLKSRDSVQIHPNIR